MTEDGKPEQPEKALNAALAKAQGEFPSIPKDRTVSTGSYTFSYAPLDTILGVCRPILTKHGLAITQLLEQNGSGRPSIRTELRHSGGGMVGASFPLPQVPDSPQKLGSLLTYLRRYAIVALLGIATEDDDDGQQAERADGEASAAEPLLTSEQRRTLFALFDQSEFSERSTRLAWTNAMLGPSRKISSSNELTEAEADKIIRILGRRIRERRTVDEPEIPYGELPDDY
jgi:ERF superfamily